MPTDEPSITERPVIEQIARFVAGTPRIDRPVALARARDAVHDTVACMVGGAGDAGAASVRRALANYGSGPATVVGGMAPAHAPWAALANGTAAHALDFDDNFLPGLTHASAVLVPALLALAEQEQRGGADVLDAYIIGLEIHALLGRGIGRRHYDLGWHSTATVGCIGTAAACARLLGLDATRAAHALSLAVSMASGVKVQFGSTGKPLHAGLAAHHAVLACTLATAGVEGRAEAIEGERGFRDLYAGDADADWPKLLQGLGDPLAIEAYGLAPKLYPCCGSAHRVLDAVLALRAAHGFLAADVARVDATVGYGNKRNLCYPRPTQEMEARFSLHYCVAVALLHGRVSLADFTTAAVQRPEARALLGLTTMHATEPGAEGADPTRRLPHRVTITLHDGRVLDDEVLWPRGTIGNPFAPGDLAAKFDDCCAGILDPTATDGARRALEDFGALDDIGRLTRHLRFEAGADRGERFSASRGHGTSEAAE
ncbi:MAG: MmgE/PrpD family protein [Ectothiorhodospiraceae bacterium]|nr:MmgE/PrpD family protein [Ectothiorhodospiraceae bacterium]